MSSKEAQGALPMEPSRPTCGVLPGGVGGAPCAAVLAEGEGGDPP